MVFNFTVIDLAVLVLLNISSLLKKDPVLEGSKSFFSCFLFSSAALVSVLLAYLSRTIMILMTRRVIAISVLNRADLPYMNLKISGSTKYFVKKLNTKSMIITSTMVMDP